jgi:hypothetical protein
LEGVGETFGELRGFGFLESCHHCKWMPKKRGRGVKSINSYNRVAKYPNDLKAPHVRKTAKQLTVKADCLHIEFGMMAGLPRRSCRCIQSANAGIKAIAIARVAIFVGSWIRDELPVITLPNNEPLLNCDLRRASTYAMV